MVARDSRWAAQFVAERNLLGLLPGRFAAIEPVGSTAVAQPPAKPIFDLLAAVSTINEADATAVQRFAGQKLNLAEQYKRGRESRTNAKAALSMKSSPRVT